MSFLRSFLLNAWSVPVRWTRSGVGQKIRARSFGLKAKITFLVILNVAAVLFVSTFIDFHLAQKGQIDLFLDRNLYIAKQIDIAIPDEKVVENLFSIREEVEEWLLSRPSLMEIDVFLFSQKGMESIVTTSKWNVPKTTFAASADQVQRLKRDKYLSSLRDVEDEKWLEIVVPLHSGKKIIGGIRVVSSLDEAQSYLSNKKRWSLILTFCSIVVILITLTLLFGKLVGSPIQKLVEAMSKATKGDLEAEAHIRSRDELGELGRHFNRMLRTIRETHQQNIQLLAQVNRFNEELTKNVEEATSELARRNEELRLLNEALFESQRQLSQSEKLAALGQVAATLAHQIGTPLNSISGYIQLMVQERDFSPGDRERLQIIETQLDRLADSVKNLLSFTRQPKPQMRSLNVNGLLQELIHLSEPWLLARNVKLSSSLCPDPPPILGDPTQLQSLFFNLITNALDAMPDGGLLRIGSRECADNEWIEISIADTGIGITEESKKKIFEPFFTTKKVGEGTGLGLSICGKIVKEHSGRLEVKSQVGRGSTFSVFMPVEERSSV